MNILIHMPPFFVYTDLCHGYMLYGDILLHLYMCDRKADSDTTEDLSNEFSREDA